MRHSPFTAVYDACVLYRAPLRDFLMWLGLSGLFRARWSEQIHDEWKRNLLKNRPDLTAGMLDRTAALMDRAIPDGLVRDYALQSDASGAPEWPAIRRCRCRKSGTPPSSRPIHCRPWEHSPWVPPPYFPSVSSLAGSGASPRSSRSNSASVHIDLIAICAIQKTRVNAISEKFTRGLAIH